MSGHTPWKDIKHKKNRISIPALREWSYDSPALTPNMVSALVEAVEAARALLAKRQPTTGSSSVSPERQRLDVALARFDFGEEK